LVGDVSNAAKEKLLQLAGHHQHHENQNQEFIRLEGSSNLKSQSGVKSLKVAPPKVGALHFKGGWCFVLVFMSSLNRCKIYCELFGIR